MTAAAERLDLPINAAEVQDAADKHLETEKARAVDKDDVAEDRQMRNDAGGMAKKLNKMKKSERDGFMDQIIVVLTKLSLQNALGLREVFGAIFVTFVGPLAHAMATAALQAGKDYNTKIKEMTPDQRQSGEHGPPYLWVWVALAEVWTQQEGLEQPTKDALCK